MLNMLKVHTEPRISAGTMAGFSSGSVMCLNCCHLSAPSTEAAS